MPSLQISKTSVENVTPEAKDSYLWDQAMKGFGVKITPRGKRVYFIQYRIGGSRGRTRRLTLGQHGILTADQARKKAKNLLGLVATGRDPAEERDQQRNEPLLGDALDDFLREHVDSKLKPVSAREYRRIVRLYISQALRQRKITKVNNVDISRLHHAMREKPYQANRVLAVLHKFFNWCEQRELRPAHSNPCQHIQKYREKARERYLTPAELKRLGEILDQLSQENVYSPWIIAAIRLLLLTGARLNEILSLQWMHVDLNNACLNLPDSKTGSKTIHLSPPALQLLSKVPRIDGNPYVICGRRTGAHLINLQKPWSHIRELADLDDVRIHDLRHTYASWAVRKGISLPILGSLIGHSQPESTARYAHLASDPLRSANDRIGSDIAALLNMR